LSELKAEIREGKIIYKDIPHQEYVFRYFEGKEISLTIDKYIDKKSSNQNRYLHKILTLLAEYLGYSLIEMKILVKKEVGLYDYVINKKTGEQVKELKSVANMTKEEVGKMIDYILQIGAEAGLQILTPEEFFET
jgi:hypothetical protein